MKIRNTSNKYIRCILSNNRFETVVEAEYKERSIRLTDTVIDTGCEYTVIMYRELYNFEDDRKRVEAKRQAIIDNECSLGCGVETFLAEDINLDNMNIEDKIKCKNIVTTEKFNRINLQGIIVGDRELCVSYDFNGNSLIGMDLLKEFDIHIARSVKTGDTVLLACQLNKINTEYVKALVEEFNVGNKIVAELTSRISDRTLEANSINSRIGGIME